MTRPGSECAPDPVAGVRGAGGVHGAANAEIVQADADEGKAEATLRAELAREGHQLHRLASGGWLVTRWGLCRELPSLHAVRTFARQVGCLR